jgi:hypothetical protein
MDIQKINEILHRDKIQDLYHIHVGNGVIVHGPRVPMTRYTEFVSVETEKGGDIASFRIRDAESPELEGLVGPQQVEVRSIGPGTLHLSFVATDSTTGEAIPGVEPVGVTVLAS